MADNTIARIVEDVTGRFRGTITAEEAAKRKAPPFGCSYRCMGKCVDPLTKKRTRCNAEVTPYSVSKKAPNGQIEVCYYFREYQDHDDGLGESMEGKGGLHKGHAPFCEFGDPSAMKISKEYLEVYEVENGSMAEAVAWCRKPEPKKQCDVPESPSALGAGGGVNNTKASKTKITRGVGRRSIKAKRAKEFWFQAENNGGSDDVMSVSNYERIRNGGLNGEGPKVYMAGTCPNFRDVAVAIDRQHPELAHENYTILADPFFGEPVIFALVDKLPIDGSWQKKSKRKIDVKSVKKFVFEGYSEVEEVVGENEVRKKKGFKHEHGPYFAVMCEWKRLPLIVNGEERMAYVGEIYALGAQLEFFEVNDLMGAKEKLRHW